MFFALPAGSGSGRLPCSVSRIPLRGAASRSQGCGSLPTAARVISTPLQPNLFYHKSQCTATFQGKLSNKYNVNLLHVFVTICNFWKILPFNKIKRTVYSKNSQALHFLYLRAEKTPPAAKRLGALFHFFSVRRRTVSTAACTSFDMDISDTVSYTHLRAHET